MSSPYKYKHQQEHDAIEAPMVFYGRIKMLMMGASIIAVFLPFVSLYMIVCMLCFSILFALLEMRWAEHHYRWHMENDV